MSISSVKSDPIWIPIDEWELMKSSKNLVIYERRRLLRPSLLQTHKRYLNSVLVLCGIY